MLNNGFTIQEEWLLRQDNIMFRLKGMACLIAAAELRRPGNSLLSIARARSVMLNFGLIFDQLRGTMSACLIAPVYSDATYP